MIMHKAQRRTTVRNSNIELVRLIAMAMVMLNHSPWGASHYLDASAGYLQRLGSTQLVSFLGNWGGVGDCLFFIISAWFLCDEKQSYAKNVSRCWHLEKQLWFWSIVLFIGCVAVWHVQGNMPGTKSFAALGLKTVFPFAANMWWYPTSYMLFLAVCPLLTQGLRLLTRNQHAALCVGLLLIFGWTPWRLFPLNMGYSVLLFFYLYILVCFVKWHMPDLSVSRSMAYRLLVVGLVVGLGSQLFIQSLLPNRIVWSMWMNSPRCLSSICIALAIVIIATTAKPRYSKVINYIAASTLAVYLVSTHPLADLVLKPLAARTQTGIVAIWQVLAMAAAVYITALIIDMIRHWVFSWTVDRNAPRQSVWMVSKLKQVRNVGIRLLDRLATSSRSQ